MRNMPRKKQVILTRSVRTFLREPRTARLATIGADGYPHIVPIWFMLDGNDLIFGSSDGERKVWNARRNPKGAVVIGGEPEVDRRGYMIQGNLSVEEDPAGKFIRRLAEHYDSANEADEWARGARVVIRLKPKKVIRVW